MSTTLNTEHLSIYLNDHLGGSVGGVELARRCLSNNEDEGALSEFLGRFIRDLEDDQATLRDVMARLNIHRSQLKEAAGWITEKLARLKPNGNLIAYSDLSRVIELEGLLIGSHGRLCMWQSLDACMTSAEVLSGIDVRGRIERTRSHLDTLEHHRNEAAQRAFGC